MAKYLKFISDGTWYDEGTEALYEYGIPPNVEIRRMTLQKFLEICKDFEGGGDEAVPFAVFVGIKDGGWDGECCGFDEFTITFVEEDRIEER